MVRTLPVVVGLVSAGAMGCAGESAPDADQDSGLPVEVELEITHCVPGIWKYPDQPCRCFGTVLDSPECAQSDCAEAPFELLLDGGERVYPTIQWSPSTRSLSAMGGEALANGQRGVWMIDSSELIRIGASGERDSAPVRCTAENLELVGYRTYERPEEGIANAVLGAAEAASWTGVSYEP